jgi:hypothetical protein
MFTTCGQHNEKLNEADWVQLDSGARYNMNEQRGKQVLLQMVKKTPQ